MNDMELLAQYRRIMNALHNGGNIFYPAMITEMDDLGQPIQTVKNNGRYEAYKLIAVIASNLRTAMLKKLYEIS